MPRTVNRRILSDTLLVGALLSAGKAAGAFKVILMAGVFGSSDTLDAFLVAFLVPSFFADVIAGPLSGALIPALIETRTRRGRQSANELQASLTAMLLAVLSVVAVILAAAAPLVLPLLGSSFSPQKLETTRSLFLYLLPLVPLSALGVSWRAALNSEERFAVAALAPCVTPLLTVALLLTASHWGVWALVLGTLGGGLLELAVLAAGSYRLGLPLLPRWTGCGVQVHAVTAQHVPLIFVAVISNGGVLIDQSMAAMLGSGSVSAFSYGTRLTTVVAGVAAAAVATAALPHLSRMVSGGDWKAARHTLTTYCRLIVLLGIPFTALMYYSSVPLVRLMFQRGAFSEDTVATVAAVQRMAVLQIPIVVLLGLLMRFVSSLRANAMLPRVAVVAFLLNIALDYVLARWIGLPGIALATSVVQSVSLVYTWFLIASRFPRGEAC